MAVCQSHRGAALVVFVPQKTSRGGERQKKTWLLERPSQLGASGPSWSGWTQYKEKNQKYRSCMFPCLDMPPLPGPSYHHLIWSSCSLPPSPPPHPCFLPFKKQTLVIHLHFTDKKTEDQRAWCYSHGCHWSHGAFVTSRAPFKCENSSPIYPNPKVVELLIIPHFIVLGRYSFF